MASFFEKLKKGMGIEAPEEELEKAGKVEEAEGGEEDKSSSPPFAAARVIEEVREKAPKESKLPTGQAPNQRLRHGTGQAKPTTRKKKTQKLKVETKLVEQEVKKIGKPEAKEEKLTESKIESKAGSKIESKKEKWFEPEGQLTVDVYQTDSDLVIQSTIAGVRAEDLDISIESDTVLIKGNRKQPPEQEERSYFYQECYWGPFSRQIILPEETDPGRAQASMREGVLTIRIPKIERTKKRKIVVAD